MEGGRPSGNAAARVSISSCGLAVSLCGQAVLRLRNIQYVIIICFHNHLTPPDHSDNSTINTPLSPTFSLRVLIYLL